ncbi:MAG: hypothetical protein JNL58_22115 [Planctomyces sp.]|nr:hypothetical protein [Planctomyces sp.]
MGRSFATVLILASLYLACGCTETPPPRKPDSSKPDPPEATLSVATTSCLRDSGLLRVNLPMFYDETGIWVSSFSPAAEIQFVLDGFSDKRVPVFHSDFILIGPPNGRLRERPPASLDVALRIIEAEDLTFISRGDRSDTHLKEQELWDSVAITSKNHRLRR